MAKQLAVWFEVNTPQSKDLFLEAWPIWETLVDRLCIVTSEAMLPHLFDGWGTHIPIQWGVKSNYWLPVGPDPKNPNPEAINDVAGWKRLIHDVRMCPQSCSGPFIIANETMQIGYCNAETKPKLNDGFVEAMSDIVGSVLWYPGMTGRTQQWMYRQAEIMAIVKRCASRLHVVDATYNKPNDGDDTYRAHNYKANLALVDGDFDRIMYLVHAYLTPPYGSAEWIKNRLEMELRDKQVLLNPGISGALQVGETLAAVLGGK